MTQLLKLADKDIKIVIITVSKMLKMLRHGESKNTHIKLLEMKTIMTEMKNTLNGINSKLDIAEDNVGKLVNTLKETVKNETHREKTTYKNENNIRKLWNNFK